MLASNILISESTSRLLAARGAGWLFVLEGSSRYLEDYLAAACIVAVMGIVQFLNGFSSRCPLHGYPGF